MNTKQVPSWYPRQAREAEYRISNDAELFVEGTNPVGHGRVAFGVVTSESDEMASAQAVAEHVSGPARLVSTGRENVVDVVIPVWYDRDDEMFLDEFGRAIDEKVGVDGDDILLELE